MEECSDSESTIKRTFGLFILDALTLDDCNEEFLLDRSSSVSELVDDLDDEPSGLTTLGGDFYLAWVKVPADFRAAFKVILAEEIEFIRFVVGLSDDYSYVFARW